MQICDKCGSKYFISTHDFIAEMILLDTILKNLQSNLEHPNIRKNAIQQIVAVRAWFKNKLVDNNQGGQNGQDNGIS